MAMTTHGHQDNFLFSGLFAMQHFPDCGSNGMGWFRSWYRTFCASKLQGSCKKRMQFTSVIIRIFTSLGSYSTKVSYQLYYFSFFYF